MIIAAPGSRSEGFRMRVFPVTVAIGIDQRGIMLSAFVVRIAAHRQQRDIRRKIKWSDAK
jgi:hypothetical protein